MSYLEIENLSTHFTDARGNVLKAVDDVSLTVEKGEIVGLVGESGCGKSTLSRSVMQLIPPTSGRVVLDGTDFSKLGKSDLRKRRLDFQMIFQDPYASLNPRMTVASTLGEAVRTRHPGLSGAALQQHVAGLMAKTGLDPRALRKYPHEFSGGQRQRIAIARALAPEPKLLMADEPVSALDVSIQSQILNLLKQLVADLGLTMIFVSHDLSVVRYISDRIAVMHFGKIVEVNEANSLMDAPRHAYTQKLLQAIPKIDLAAIRRRLKTA